MKWRLSTELIMCLETTDTTLTTGDLNTSRTELSVYRREVHCLGDVVFMIKRITSVPSEESMPL